MRKAAQYPVVDLFAGPGGLGEGFAACLGDDDTLRFRSLVSIERDLFSHSTLLLRHFLRSFPAGELPDAYYDYLHDSIGIEDLYGQYKIQFVEAGKSALQLSLGPKTREDVRKIIEKRLAGRRKWTLVGGPPCAADSRAARTVRKRGGVKSWRSQPGIGELAELIEKTGACLLYLPPYHPELNPIEMAWSRIKHFLQKAQARTKGALYETLAKALNTLPSRAG